METVETKIASYRRLNYLSGAIGKMCREESRILKRLSLLVGDFEKLQKFNGQVHPPLETLGLAPDELALREKILADNEAAITEVIDGISQIRDSVGRISADFWRRDLTIEGFEACARLDAITARESRRRSHPIKRGSISS